MSERLARMARALTHHWKRGLLVALIAVFAIGGLAANAERPADDFAVPGAESQTATDLFLDHQTGLAGADANLVFTVPEGRIDSGEARGAIEATLDEVAGLDKVAEVGDPFAPGSVSSDGRLATTTVRYEGDLLEVEKADGELLEEAVREVEAAGVTVEMRGMVADIAAEQTFPVGELIGIAIAILLLTILFRSKAAMAATLAGALIGVIVGQMILSALASPLGLPEFASVIAVMLGLGAGIDYALLIIGRYREQRALGFTPRDSSAKALATAGSAVVTAGLIVVVAIAGLLVVGIPFVGKMGLAAAIAVAAVVVSSLTILPVMGGMLRRWLKPKRLADADGSPAFGRWAERVTARPWRTIAACVVLLLVFAIPVTDLRLGQPDDGNQPDSTTQRRAYDQLSEAFGPGSNGPLLLAVDIPNGDPDAAEGEIERLADAVAEAPGVDAPDGGASLQAIPSEDGEMATLFVQPATSPQDERTSDLVDHLRAEVIPAATAGTGLEVYVGGQTAGFLDFSAKVSERLPLFIAIVIGLSVLLLITAFRSLWIPLVSAGFNLLSIGAAYGVIVAVFQWGWGASLIGAEADVPIISFLPLMMFAILFGLSMDYNVFLLSRIHEAYNEGDGPRASVIHGVARVGKIVLFAGLIMTGVFLGFASAPDQISKMFAIGLGAAIMIDVLIVRLMIAPAVVTLLGERAWWLPRWLDRLLPNVSLEGHMVESVDPREDALLPDLEEEGIEGEDEAGERVREGAPA